MSIKEKLEKVKVYPAKAGAHEKELFVALLVILVALLAFGLGRLSRLEADREPVTIENAEVKK
ncbi:MAG TPA: hypothetical protein P5274_02670 [Candidatus Paceibacterota bacterium]|nr:hypothetical protein [Candidatus Paceibacterota bacterium]